MIILLILNFVINLCFVAYSIVRNFYGIYRTLYRINKEWQEGRISKTTKRRQHLIETFGEEAYPSLQNYIDRESELEFCQTYGEERRWMLSVGLDVSDNPEEEQFLAAMSKHKFQERRQIVNQALVLRKILIKHNIQKNRVDHRIRAFFEDKPENDNEAGEEDSKKSEGDEQPTVKSDP